MSNVNVDYSVTLKALRRAGACYSGYNKVVRSLQGLPFTPADAGRESYIRYVNNDKISLLFILNSNGLDDTIWTLRYIDNVERDARLYIVWCARQVQHLMTDSRSIDAIDVAERYANGQATDIDLADARDVAASAARSTVSDIAWVVAWDVARSAVRNVARSIARDVARSAAMVVAWDVARSAQKDMLILMINGKAPWQQ